MFQQYKIIVGPQKAGFGLHTHLDRVAKTGMRQIFEHNIRPANIGVGCPPGIIRNDIGIDRSGGKLDEGVDAAQSGAFGFIRTRIEPPAAKTSRCRRKSNIRIDARQEIDGIRTVGKHHAFV